ncbi:hypothetical protein CXF95_13410 [Paraglaciecola sp. MB-3u-78]|nr:hypothetical protein CXF95_13410 [Paraglaciecola sp. MB-3u-78]
MIWTLAVSKIIDHVDISSGGSSTAFLAFNVSAKNGLFLGKMTWKSLNHWDILKLVNHTP